MYYIYVCIFDDVALFNNDRPKTLFSNKITQGQLRKAGIGIGERFILPRNSRL